MKKSIIIIGGGISGLTLLHYLSEKYQLDEAVEVTLIEKNDRLGGNIQTREENGVYFETGSNGFINNAPQTLKFLEEIGLKGRIITASATSKNRYIGFHNKLHALPVNMKEFFFFPLLKKRDKIAVVREYFKKGEDRPNETIFEFAQRRFNNRIAERLFDPFVSGVFAGDIRQLHLKSCFPQLYEMEQSHGSLLKGLKAKGLSKGVLQSLEKGMGMMISQIYKKYSSQIHLSESMESMEYRQRDLFIQTNKREMHVDELYITTPAYVASRMFGRIDQILAEHLQQIPYAPLAVIGLVFHKEEWSQPVTGYGYLKPSQEHSPVLGVLFEDQIFDGRVPEDKVFFRVMIGGARHPDILEKSQEDIIALAKEEVREMLQLKTEPAHVFYQAWPNAIPQYNQNYVEIIKKVEERRRQHPALRLLGNYIGGISFNNCITNAHQIAQAS